MRFILPLLLGSILISSPDTQGAESRQVQRLRQMDKSGDGKLSESEVSAKLWLRLLPFDANEDGLISQEEMAALGAGGDKSKSRPGGANTAFEIKTFKGSNGQAISYSLYSPKKVDGETPLILCLHGRGGNTQAANIAASSKVQSKQASFVMAPACDGRKARWADGGFRSKDSHRSVMPELMEAIDALVKDLPIDPNRIYITGQSMGGVGTWGMVAAHPDKFAAAAPVCGIWDPGDAAKMKDVPIWAFHGEKDNTVPVSGSRDMVAAIEATGGKPKYTEFPGIGHGSWEPAYAVDEFWTWLFQQSLDKR